MNRIGTYDADDILRRYITFMITAGNHRDTYIEECHRNFFANYAKGRPTHKCGVQEKHIGGLVGIIPVVAFYHNRPDKARKAALAHLALTHPGDKMETALIVNTNLGGDNAARGAVLGALLGASNGIEKFPDRWAQGLLEPLPELNLPETAVNTALI